MYNLICLLTDVLKFSNSSRKILKSVGALVDGLSVALFVFGLVTGRLTGDFLEACGSLPLNHDVELSV